MKSYGNKTLQEIQDLPLSEMHYHLKKHVDPNWGESDKICNLSKTLLDYEVKAKLETIEYVSFAVKARSKVEATEVARVYIDQSFEFDNYEITELELTD